MVIKQDDAAKRGSEVYHATDRAGPWDALDWASMAIVGPIKWDHDRTMSWCK